MDALRDALRNGRLRPGTPLRTGIHDAAAWGTSHPTFRAALRELEKTGELESAPRGFRVPFPHVKAASTNVLWLSACDPTGVIVGEFEREARLRRHLDLACRRDGLHLRVVGLDQQSRAFVEGTAPCDFQPLLKDAFGVVLCPWRMGTEGTLVAERLSRTNLPAAVWAEGGIQSMTLEGGRTRVFDNGHMKDPGRGVGIHLRELGHRNIAYLSVLHGTDWSRLRLEGLQAAMEPNGSVLPILLDGVPPVSGLPLTRDAILESLEPRATQRNGIFRRNVADITSAYALLLREESRIGIMEPMFEKALADKSVTAWVFANDSQALLAMLWLRDRGVDVPGAISIVGFDDSNRGQDLGLTSWSFAEFDLAEAMVRHLVKPTTGPATIRIEGSLVVRGSTARRMD